MLYSVSVLQKIVCSQNILPQCLFIYKFIYCFTHNFFPPFFFDSIITVNITVSVKNKKAGTKIEII